MSLDNLSYNDITYKKLDNFGAETNYTSHILHFKKLFENFKPQGFLEWGCGLSTKFFIENSKQVVSIEFINYDWPQKLKEIFGHISNWEMIVWNPPDAVSKACGYANSDQMDYAKIDYQYIVELNNYFTFIKELYFTNCPIDVSFVDAGVMIRGDLVELSLQNQVPVVIAHDIGKQWLNYSSSVDKSTYVWFKIQEHPEYEKIHINYGCTMFWIHKSYENLISIMKDYEKTHLQYRQDFIKNEN